MFLGGNLLGRVLQRQGRTELGDDFSAVALLAHPMHRHARLCLARRLHGLVHMMPIHASAAILGQQSGMEIEHAPMVGLDQKRGNHEQKTGQDDEVDAVLAHQGKEQVFAVEVGFIHHHGGDVVVLGSHQCVGIRPIAQHQGYFYPCMVMEMADDVLAVGSVARNKNGYSYHAVYLFFFFSAGQCTRPVPLSDAFHRCS